MLLRFLGVHARSQFCKREFAPRSSAMKISKQLWMDTPPERTVAKFWNSEGSHLEKADIVLQDAKTFIGRRQNF